MTAAPVATSAEEYAIDNGPVAQVLRALDHVPSISLEAMDRVSLFDRIETKLLLPARCVPDVIADCSHAYRVLEIAGLRAHRYHTTYFDTPEFRFYHEHHAGRTPRHKVRARRYMDSGQRVLEVKCRQGTGRHRKERLVLGHADHDPMDRLWELGALLPAAVMAPGALLATAAVRYTRITLVGLAAEERVTIDLLLDCAAGSSEVAIPQIAVLESKRGTRSPSPGLESARLHRFRPTGFSKYCWAIATLERSVKQNRYKRLLDFIHLAGA